MRRSNPQTIIDTYATLRPALERLASSGTPRPLDSVRLRPPLPRASKVMCCITNYWEHAQREARPLNMFLKNPDAVVGHGDTIHLPNFTVPWMFMHESELAIVLKGPARNVAQSDWRTAVFGYTRNTENRIQLGRATTGLELAASAWIRRSLGMSCPTRRPMPHSVAMPKSGYTALATLIRLRVPSAPSV